MTVMKTLSQIVGAVGVALVAAFADSTVTGEEWVNVAIIAVGACMVFAAPNVPGAMYTKTIISTLTAGLTVLASVITGGVTTAEFMQIAVAAASAFAVYRVPNQTDEVTRGRHAAKEA